MVKMENTTLKSMLENQTDRLLKLEEILGKIKPVEEQNIDLKSKLEQLSDRFPKIEQKGR